MKRLEIIRNQLSLSSTQAIKHNMKTDEDVVICCAIRTALTPSRKGELSGIEIEQMMKPLIEYTLKTHNITPTQIEDICIGNVLSNGCGLVQNRIAALISNIPESVPVMTVNRLCASGLEAINVVAQKIQNKQISLALAGGVESMSLDPFAKMLDIKPLSDEAKNHQKASNCLMPMGMTSENVIEKYGINRQELDEFALKSQNKAKLAQSNGLFKEEILPIQVKKKNNDGSTTEITVSKDSGIRNSTIENLQKLKPAFKPNGISTAGNSSQIVDGAALVLVASRKAARQLNLPIIAQFLDYTTVGVPPEIMGIGPLQAIPKLLNQNNLKIDDIDIYEINEAFASQALHCIKSLKIDEKKVNPKGGAIALGHPLGCTGARQVCTLLPELKRTNSKLGIVSMCVGTGMGAAALFLNEQQKEQK